jgi:3-oxoacyl-[acyl-carrier protein] reductase
MQKIAIVTGAARGIGAAVSRRLAADGFAVVVNFASNRDEAERQVGAIEQASGKARAVLADVSDAGSVRALFDEAEQVYGGVDVLVNNAGIMQLAPLAEAKDEHFERHVAVNLRGSFNCMREAARRLRQGGRIINFSSSVVGLYQPSYGVYAATKAGIEALTHVLANELRGREITVNCVAPGPTATELFLTGKPPEVVERLRKLAPLERLGQPEDIAAVVAFLAGPDGAWVNAQIAAVLGPVAAAASIIATTLKGLQAMNKDSPWITLFDRESQRASANQFQLAYVDAPDAKAPVMKLASFELDAEGSVTQVLFFKFGTQKATLKHNSTTLSMNLGIFDAVQNAVQQRVATFLTGKVAALDI